MDWRRIGVVTVFVKDEGVEVLAEAFFPVSFRGKHVAEDIRWGLEAVLEAVEQEIGEILSDFELWLEIAQRETLTWARAAAMDRAHEDGTVLVEWTRAIAGRRRTNG